MVTNVTGDRQEMGKAMFRAVSIACMEKTGSDAVIFGCCDLLEFLCWLLRTTYRKPL